MEPLSALALACNVLDLVERGIKCGRLVSALYKDGATDDQEALEAMADTMGSVIVALQEAPRNANIRKSALDPQIDKLLARSTTLCTQLRDLVHKCQPPTRGSWKTAGLAALRKAVHKSEVEALEKDLESCRNGLVALFCAATQYVRFNPNSFTHSPPDSVLSTYIMSPRTPHLP